MPIRVAKKLSEQKQMSVFSDAETLARAYADRHQCDVILYNGDINPGLNIDLKETIRSKKRYDKALLILTTPGGDADSAYRIARCFQENYQTFIIFISGWCKSAGTLLCIGAHDIIMGDDGELGPLDVQLSKTDELGEYDSGLVVQSAIESLYNTGFTMFEQYFMSIKAKSSGRITFKTATDIASNMVVKMLTPIYSQIDPQRIGETARSMSVGMDYGRRLNSVSRNLQSQRALSGLVSSYCSHGFVIDRKEASDIFHRVSAPGADLAEIAEALDDWALVPMDNDALFLYLSNELPADEESADAPSNTPSEEGRDTSAVVVEGDFGRPVSEPVEPDRSSPTVVGLDS